jgi:integrase
VKDLELAARSHRLTHHVVTQIVAGRKVSVQQAFTEWSDWLEACGKAPRTVLCTTTNVAAWIRDMKLEQMVPGVVTEKHINGWINSKDSTDKASSRKVVLSNIRNFCQFCIAKGYTIANPAALVRVRMDILSHAQKEKKETAPLTDAEVTALLNHTEESGEIFWHVATAIARWVGLRLGDIAQLEWDCFNKPGTIAVWTDKRDKRIELPLTTELANAVAKIPVNSGKYCFPDERKVYTEKSPGYLSMEFKRICEKAGVEDHSFHDLRRSYATDCARRGIQSSTLELRWRTPAASRRKDISMSEADIDGLSVEERKPSSQD